MLCWGNLRMKGVGLGVIALLLSASSGQNSDPPIQSPPSGQAASSQARSADDRPTTSLPYTPSLDVSSMDKSVDPCADLYTIPAAAG